MKMLMEISIPPESFGADAGQKIGRIMEHLKPEAAYFTTVDGNRGGYLIVNLDDPSQIPSLAEPWFLTFNAKVTLKSVMSPEDLQSAGLEEISRNWG